MSAKRETLRERTQRFRRRMRGQNKAVSPVVATLILILIAVAAAAALYLWLVAWQGNITGGIGNQQVQATFTIGGSTSVYPFSSLGVSWYEQNHSDVVIQDDQGGTGAGMLAVCAGHIDVGAASSLETVSGLQSSDGCPSTAGITITTIGYDAVDVIVPVGNLHGLVSVSYDTLTAIYDGSTIAQGGTATLQAPSINGQLLSSALFTGAGFVATGKISAALTWDEIPAAVDGATVQATVEAPAAGVGGVVTTDWTTCGNDICAVSGTHDTPCGFLVCAGGANGAGTAAGDYGATIITYARSDASGTTQTFEARLLAAASSSTFESSFTGLGFSGCGSNNYISDCGLIADKTANGNPAVISGVAGNADAIGYASDGLARAATSGVTCENTATAACGIGLEAPGQSAAVQPSLSATGSIAGGIINGGFGAPGLTTTLSDAQSYAGARPFEFVTLQPPAGEVSDFFTFITAPDVNQNLATATGGVSLYSI